MRVTLRDGVRERDTVAVMDTVAVTDAVAVPVGAHSDALAPVVYSVHVGLAPLATVLPGVLSV